MQGLSLPQRYHFELDVAENMKQSDKTTTAVLHPDRSSQILTSSPSSLLTPSFQSSSLLLLLSLFFTGFRNARSP